MSHEGPDGTLLNDLSSPQQRTTEPNRTHRAPEQHDGFGDMDKIDVHNFAGLVTILAVNIQQLYLLVQVGSELGPMFYVLISLTSVSAILVILLLPIRVVLEACKKMQINRRIKTGLYYTSLVLNVLILVLNLVLQIFDQTMEKCTVLLSQPLPIAATNPK